MTTSGWPGGSPGPGPGQGSGSGWGATPPGAGWGGAQSAGGSGGGSGWPAGGPSGPPSAPGFAGPDWSSSAPAGGPAGSWTPPASGPEPAGDARPPMIWLWAAIAGPLIGVGLIFLPGWGANVAGWAATVVLGLGLLVVFTSVDLRRRASPWYLARPGIVGALRLAVAAGAIIVAGIHAYLLADFIARLDWWA